MYHIEFYRQENGYSPMEALMNELESRAHESKDGRIQWKQMVRQIDTLAELGIECMPVNMTKHIDENLWELRPGRRRVLYFYHKGNTYVLLHSFIKKTQKTPRREIEKAKRERNDYLRRKG